MRIDRKYALNHVSRPFNRMSLEDNSAAGRPQSNSLPARAKSGQGSAGMMTATRSGKYADGSTRGSRPLARTLIRWLVAFVFVIGVTECTLRFGLGLGNPVLIARDAACSYTLKPDQDVVRFFVRTHINHYGMRSDEVPAARTPGVVRLMFVGDSITYGTTRIDQRQIFTELLHRQLPAVLDRPVEVLNASAGGWAPENELAFLQSRGVFQSDIVLLVLNDGDLTQPPSTISAVGNDLPQRRPATAIGELFTRYIRPRMMRTLPKSDAGDSVAAKSEGTVSENFCNLENMRVLVESQRARLVIIFIPFRRDIPNLSSVSESELRAWSDIHRVPMFDLTSAELPYSARDLSLDNGIHFNAKGHAVIAQAIARDWPTVIGKK